MTTEAVAVECYNAGAEKACILFENTINREIEKHGMNKIVPLYVVKDLIGLVCETIREQPMTKLN